MEESSENRYQQGLTAIQDGDYEKAENVAMWCLQICPEDPQHSIYLADLIFKAGDRLRADSILTRILHIKPDSWKALAVRGRLLFHTQNIGEAIICLRQSVELKATTFVYTILAAAQLDSGLNIDAIASADMALELDPDWKEAATLRKWAIDRIESNKVEDLEDQGFQLVFGMTEQ